MKRLIEGLQEKFQVNQRLPPQEPDRWRSDKAARVAKGFPGRSNRMPPGQDIEDQAQTDQRATPFVMGGESDASEDYNSGAMRTGFTQRPMSATEDEYSNQHNDAFYDDLGGFVERNNMLDRL